MSPTAVRRRRFRLKTRTRLTLLYGVVTFGTGTVVVGLTYLLLQSQASDTVGRIFITKLKSFPSDHNPSAARAVAQPQSDAMALTNSVSDALLDQVLVYSLLSLALLVLLAVGLGWWMAGRALHPIHRMTAAARRISANNLHERIALDGPHDELKELADTFDGLLKRLETSFASQRRFVANAAHELRTPLAISRATLQIALEEPPEDPGQVTLVRDQLLMINRRSEHLIDGLLVLATSDRGLTRRQPVDLAALATGVVHDLDTAAQDRGITVETRIGHLAAVGDPVLLRHLITNLLHNAIRHNTPGGRVSLHAASPDGLTVCNTGPIIPEDAVPALFEPFRRLRTDRTASDGGAGLGLSIAQSIAHAHGGTLRAHPNPDGGLTVRFTLPHGETTSLTEVD